MAVRIPSLPPTEVIIERLDVLWKKLEDEGLYVSANTVQLAVWALLNTAVNAALDEKRHKQMDEDEARK